MTSARASAGVRKPASACFSSRRSSGVTKRSTRRFRERGCRGRADWPRRDRSRSSVTARTTWFSSTSGWPAARRCVRRVIALLGRGQTKQFGRIELERARHAVGELRPMRRKPAEDRNDGAGGADAAQVEAHWPSDFVAAVFERLRLVEDGISWLGPGSLLASRPRVAPRARSSGLRRRAGVRSRPARLPIRRWHRR